ncbi:MAG: hypothetical protein Q8Q94_04125 [bacterium]|nr:hypothetical protein [bacterium]MDZ4299470.1 hypothetical protein [Candidatus Sungbacteria bacterium]
MAKQLRTSTKSDGLLTQGYLDARLTLLETSVKEDLREEMRGQTAKVLQAVDKIVSGFDRKEKEGAAHTLLHKRHTDRIDEHEKRINKLEQVR